MGIYGSFKCTKCRYKVDVNGGYGCGEAVGQHTVSCVECRKLFDVVVTRAPWNIKSDPVTRQPDISGFDSISCPKNESHHVTLWTFPEGKCPKCGHEMIEYDPGYSRCWD
jgi:hypothetical protein